MGIEICFQNNIRGDDIRGSAFYIEDAFHEYITHLCVGNDIFPLLDRFCLIDAEVDIYIEPHEFKYYVSELEKVLVLGENWEPAKKCINNLIGLFGVEIAKNNGFKCLADN